MRKFLALTMVALLALILALAAVGCGGGQPAQEAAPPAETVPPAETMPDTAMADTAMAR